MEQYKAYTAWFLVYTAQYTAYTAQYSVSSKLVFNFKNSPWKSYASSKKQKSLTSSFAQTSW